MYIVYLKESEVQFHVCPCVVQLLEVDVGFRK